MTLTLSSPAIGRRPATIRRRSATIRWRPASIGWRPISISARIPVLPVTTTGIPTTTAIPATAPAIVRLTIPAAGSGTSRTFRPATPTATPVATGIVLSGVLMMTMLFLPVGFLQRLQADLPNQIHKPAFLRFLGLPRSHFHRVQCVGDRILHIQLPDLPHPLDSQRVLLVAVRQHIPHQVLENVFFDQARRAFSHLQLFRIVRKVLQRIQIGIQLVVQTAFQPPALTT